MEDLLETALKVLGLILASVAYFQLQEVRKKRAIEMFWKVAESNSSNEHKEARKSIWKLTNILNKK